MLTHSGRPPAIVNGAECDPARSRFVVHAGQWFGAGALVNMPDEALRYTHDVDEADPIALARTFMRSTLVVQGGNDTSVPTHRGERLRDALLERPNGAGSTSYLFVPNVTHMFRVVPSELVGQAAFGYPGPTDPRVTDGIDRWYEHSESSYEFSIVRGYDRP